MVWAPLGLVTLGCALFGLRLGLIAATTSETDVITHFAADYLDTHPGAAQLTDCVAVPGDAYPGIWIVVRCRPGDHTKVYEYYVNRFGGLEYSARPDAPRAQHPRAPQT